MTLPFQQAAPAEAPTSLTAAQMDTFERISEWFIPPVEGFPTIAEADPDGEVLALALEQLRPLTPGLVDALDAAEGVDIDQHLTELERRGAAEFESLRTFALGRYLSCRSVWNVLGYTGRNPIPIRPGEAEEYLSGGLLDQTVARGKIYRPTPTTK